MNAVGLVLYVLTAVTDISPENMPMITYMVINWAPVVTATVTIVMVPHYRKAFVRMFLPKAKVSSQQMS